MKVRINDFEDQTCDCCQSWAGLPNPGFTDFNLEILVEISADILAKNCVKIRSILIRREDCLKPDLMPAKGTLFPRMADVEEALQIGVEERKQVERDMGLRTD